jgi:leucyl-tRNA synthetase
MAAAYPVLAVERKWREAWRSALCFRAPDTPGSKKFFNFDSGPFPNGPLHIGHVRTYVLGDVVARYQRLLGKSVLYHTEWDAFGLPNELSALESGISPADFTAINIARMRDGLERLGVSYDWSRVQATCDPAYYRWTQWLFLLLYHNGLVYRRAANANWCPSCQTTLSSMQIEGGACWRCRTGVVSRTLPQWFVSTSCLANRLRDNVSRLEEWSDTGKRLLLRGLAAPRTGPADNEAQADWQVSRQRAWGTPIPIIHCDRCGIVPASDLPVRLPDSLDWSRGAAALRESSAFRKTQCPACGAAATRDMDTLDCFFDDAWSYLSGVPALDSLAEFPANQLAAWLPVDQFHSGFDTFGYLNLYRFIGAFVHDANLLGDDEPIRRYVGHDMVTAGGRKMSKHLGNSVVPDEVMAEYGADALRIAVLWAAGPERAVDWRHVNLQRAGNFLDQLFVLFAKSADAVANAAGRISSSTSKAAEKLESSVRTSCRRVGEFIDDYRPNAAIEELLQCSQRVEAFVFPRASSARLGSEDAMLLQESLRRIAVALSPLAPYLAEELARLSGLQTMAAVSTWPVATPE